MLRLRTPLVSLALFSLRAPSALLAQETQYDLSVLLPPANEVAEEAVISNEAPVSDWSGIAGFSREFGHPTGMLTIGSSRIMFITTTATLFETTAEAQITVAMMGGMDPHALGELFAVGFAEGMGGSLDSLSATRIEAPDVGDNATTISVYMDLGFMTGEFKWVIFQRGRYLGTLVAMGPPGEIHMSDLVPFVNTMDRRMQETPVEALPTFAGAAADAPIQPKETSRDLWAAREVGVDLEILLTRTDELPQGVRVTEESASRPLDGVASLSRSFEAAGAFTVGSSVVFTMETSLTLHDSPASALREVLRTEVEMESALDKAAAQFGEDAVTIEMVSVPGLSIPAAALYMHLESDFFKSDVFRLTFARGNLSGSLLAMGEVGKVSLIDAVELATRTLARISDLVPIRWAGAFDTADSTSVARLVEAERRLRNGEIGAALRDVRAVEERFRVFAATWEQVCRWGALWDKAEEVLEVCDRAVAMSDEHPRARDSRGIARALLTGAASGAIEDFEAFVEWTSVDGARAERRQWIERLGNGENPFTADVLKALRQQ